MPLEIDYTPHSAYRAENIHRQKSAVKEQRKALINQAFIESFRTSLNQHFEKKKMEANVRAQERLIEFRAQKDAEEKELKYQALKKHLTDSGMLNSTDPTTRQKAKDMLIEFDTGFPMTRGERAPRRPSFTDIREGDKPGALTGLIDKYISMARQGETDWKLFDLRSWGKGEAKITKPAGEVPLETYNEAWNKLRQQVEALGYDADAIEDIWWSRVEEISGKMKKPNPTNLPKEEETERDKEITKALDKKPTQEKKLKRIKAPTHWLRTQEVSDVLASKTLSDIWGELNETEKATAQQALARGVSAREILNIFKKNKNATE